MTDEEKEQFYWDNPEAIPDKEQQGNAANAAYDTLRKSVLGRDYKLERGK